MSRGGINNGVPCCWGALHSPVLAPPQLQRWTQCCEVPHPSPTYGCAGGDAHSVSSLDEGGEEGLHSRQVGGVACAQAGQWSAGRKVSRMPDH